MTNTFLGDNYELPKSTSNYMRLEDGENTIRILSSAVTGWEYFNTDNKPIRTREEVEEMPSDIKAGGKVKPFWAFICWNYNLEKIQIMEITQKTIMAQVMALIDNPKWGNVKEFDITISRKGKSLETTYSVIPNPKTEVPETVKKLYENSKINLEALFDGTNPFGE